MNRLFPFPLFLLFFFSCAGNNFDEASIPQDQLATELAFKRVADHGGLEPVVEDGQEIKDWQFHISSFSRKVVMNSDPEFTYWLKDRAGIEYTVSSNATTLSVIEQMKGTSYGYGSGTIISVERDLMGGKIEAELKLTSWRERKK